MKKFVYWLISGEGETGIWERVVTTPRGIKMRLTKERCHGDRWAYAYHDFYVTRDKQVVGFDVECGSTRFLPSKAVFDVA